MVIGNEINLIIIEVRSLNDNKITLSNSGFTSRRDVRPILLLDSLYLVPIPSRMKSDKLYAVATFSYYKFNAGKRVS